MDNKDSISNLLNRGVKEMVKVTYPNSNFIFKYIDSGLTNPALNSILNTIKNGEELRKKEHMKMINFNPLDSLYKTSKQYKKLHKNIIELNYKKVFSQSIDKVSLKLEEYENINLKYIDKNEIEELKNDLDEINKEKVVPLNWQQKLFDVYKKWSEKNPIFYRIILIIYTLFVTILSGLIINIIDKDNSNSKVIYQTTINNITITWNLKYYYEVQTTDNEYNIIDDYVSKRKYNKLNKTVEK